MTKPLIQSYSFCFSLRAPASVSLSHSPSFSDRGPSSKASTELLQNLSQLLHQSEKQLRIINYSRIGLNSHLINELWRNAKLQFIMVNIEENYINQNVVTGLTKSHSSSVGNCTKVYVDHLLNIFITIHQITSTPHSSLLSKLVRAKFLAETLSLILPWIV